MLRQALANTAHGGRTVAAACAAKSSKSDRPLVDDVPTTPRVKQSAAYGMVQTKELRRVVGLESLDPDQLAELNQLTVKPLEEETKLEGVVYWVTAAIMVGVCIGYFRGVEAAEAYFAGYILEQSLSVDNLFVFILIFEYFQCPRPLQNRVLNVGIASAAVLRLIMIILGSTMVEKFQPVLLVFAAILLYSSVKLLAAGDEEEDEDLSNNLFVKLAKRFVPVSSTYDEDKFFTIENGVKTATPLVLVLIVVELSDVLFAVDSVPAIFGVTLDPLLVYSSNMLAILSLRSLFQFVAVAMSNLRYLDKSVAAVLGFIGVKMIADFTGFHVSTESSLAVVVALLGVGVGASLIIPGGDEKREGDSA